MSQDVDRMSVTLPSSLLFELDDMVVAGKYDNRSEATRGALCVFVTGFNQQTGLPGSLSETVVVLYGHDHNGVSDEMTKLQYDFTETITVTHHVHLSDRLCLESITVDETGERAEELLSQIRPLKGVHQVRLVVVKTNRQQTSYERLWHVVNDL